MVVAAVTRAAMLVAVVDGAVMVGVVVVCAVRMGKGSGATRVKGKGWGWGSRRWQGALALEMGYWKSGCNKQGSKNIHGLSEKAMRMGTGQAQERRKKGEGQGMGVESVTVGRGMVRLNKQ